MKHTPGPWVKDRNFIEETTGKLIAEVSYKQDGFVQANAHLIASAPTMNIAIRSMLININLALKSGNDAYLRLAIEAGEQAISEAEGREER